MFLTLTTVAVAWLCAEVYLQATRQPTDEDVRRRPRHN
jgi:hypothetical protein